MSNTTPTKASARKIAARARTPGVGHARALVRFFRDPKASTLGKAMVLLAVVYVVLPADLIPDVIPVVGWLDDIGAITLALGYLWKVLGRYRGADVEVEAEGDAEQVHTALVE